MKPQVKVLEQVKVHAVDCTGADVVEELTDIYKEECMEDAFYVCDLGDILSKYRRWCKLLPRVAPHYAVKCNDDAVVLETMAGLGMGFDCASKSEIKKVLELGVRPDKIIYANPCKQRNHIKYAVNNQVKLMTFDNLDELEKVKVVCPDARLVLRILPAEYKAVCDLGIKFGAPQSDVVSLIQRARQLQLNIVGVSFHVGSGCQEAAAFPAAVQLARTTFDQLIVAGYQPYLLDIGGGFPGDDTADVTFDEICSVLAPSLDQHFPASTGVEIISEPGRYFVASAYTLAVNVIAKRRPSQDVDPEEKEKLSPAKFMYYMNDGVYGSFNCLLYDHAQVKPRLTKMLSDEELHVSSIWGPTCDGLDCILTEVKLPELHVGDWLVFDNMGAYTLSAGSTFNGMPRPRPHYIISMDELASINSASSITLRKRLLPVPPPTMITAPDIRSPAYFIQY